MNLSSRLDSQERQRPRPMRSGAWVRQLALLTFAFLASFAIPMQGYQGTQDLLLTIPTQPTRSMVSSLEAMTVTNVLTSTWFSG
jgi:hypothetical protein